MTAKAHSVEKLIQGSWLAPKIAWTTLAELSDVPDDGEYVLKYGAWKGHSIREIHETYLPYSERATGLPMQGWQYVAYLASEANHNKKVRSLAAAFLVRRYVEECVAGGVLTHD